MFREEAESQEYKDWRKAVYIRDNYKCVACRKNGYLNAHHLNGWNWYLVGRYEIANGVTLCSKCHNKFHKTFGHGDNTIYQFEVFLIGYGRTLGELNL
jgi:5-methylcytosine-specific restriction endonuclease McrA